MDPYQIKDLEVFKDVPKEQLIWFIENSMVVEYKAGQTLIEIDQMIELTYVILKGKVEFLRGEEVEIMVLEEGSITGYLPYSRIKHSIAKAKVIQDASILEFPKEKGKDLIAKYFELTQALVSVMTGRVRDSTERQKQNEKMIALGKLSAGLAHELNNPIGAIGSSAEALLKQLNFMTHSFKTIVEEKVSIEELNLINNFITSKVSSKDKSYLTLLERSKLEDDLQSWLESKNIDNSYEISENLVDSGLNTTDLDELYDMVNQNYFSAVLNFVNNNCMTEKIVHDIKEASDRISALVRSVKNYTHMDQAKVLQEEDIRDGILNTLTILDHKIKGQGLKLITEFDPSLPKVNLYKGEINQLWTNLIDNAIDAMDDVENRILTISTMRENDFIKIEINDTGKGIPEEIKDKIFDPFFTTKKIGQGTGLGLETVKSIIKMHRGTVKLKSEPGKTIFEVCLPIG